MNKFSWLFALSIFVFQVQAWTQTNNQNSFISAVDRDATIKSVALLPVTDNVSGIYARPISKMLRQLLEEERQWVYSDESTSSKASINELEANPALAAELIQKNQVDAIMGAHITRGPNGLQGRLVMFSGRQGLVLVNQEFRDQKIFETAEVESQFRYLFANLKNQVPYRGMVLSRRGQQVTVNIGSQSGLKPNDQLTVIQLIKLNRHPKLNFIVGSDKEVLGKIQVIKVDKNLSFGTIIMEREPGVVQVNSKLLPEDFIKYPSPVLLRDGTNLAGLGARADKDVAFGEAPQEWVPQAPPQYGSVAILAGLSSYRQNLSYQSAGSNGGGNSFVPNLMVKGELWISSSWIMGYHIRQGIFSMDNPYPNSSPSKLNMTIGQYGVLGGYNLLLSDEFFGPKMQITGGYQSASFGADDSSPLAVTDMTYSSLILGLSGEFPISDELPINLGANFNLYLNPKVSENTSSGISSNKVNSFGFFGTYSFNQRFKVRSELNFEQFNSDSNGGGSRPDPVTTISHKMTTFWGGLEYLF